MEDKKNDFENFDLYDGKLKKRLPNLSRSNLFRKITLTVILKIVISDRIVFCASIKKYPSNHAVSAHRI